VDALAAYLSEHHASSEAIRFLDEASANPKRGKSRALIGCGCTACLQIECLIGELQ